MKISDYMAAIVTDLKTKSDPNGDLFLRDVSTHGKVWGLQEIKNLSVSAPACRIALIGSRGTSRLVGRSGASAIAPMGRADTGQFRGPLEMIAFLVEQDQGYEEARDRVIRLADNFMTYIEHRTWGLTDNQCGPALVTTFDILYSADVDAQGAAIAAVNFEQEVWFGRDIHREDYALLTGDEQGRYPSGQTFYQEGEWADKGVLTPEKTPEIDGEVGGVFTPTTTETDTTDIDFEKYLEED